jgi:hypothetical protein
VHPHKKCAHSHRVSAQSACGRTRVTSCPWIFENRRCCKKASRTADPSPEHLGSTACSRKAMGRQLDLRIGRGCSTRCTAAPSPSASLRCTGVAKSKAKLPTPSPEHLGSTGVAKRQRHGRLGARISGRRKLGGRTTEGGKRPCLCQLARPRKGGPVEHRVLHERRQDGNWFCGISRACRSDPLPPRRLPLHCR